MTAPPPSNALRVLVLGGGPDRERPVSLKSAARVAGALRSAGHDVIERDILPNDRGALDEARQTGVNVVFPVLHGPWGEGGALQRWLADSDLPFVGAGPEAAALAMNKPAAKQVIREAGLPTPEWQVLADASEALDLDPPVVLKPDAEGSSMGVVICRTAAEVADARPAMHAEYGPILAECCITGAEVTFGIIDEQVLPGIRIEPAAGFYDFHAKYDRDDTAYQFDLGLPEARLNTLREHALAAHRAINVRHLSRVDMMVDSTGVGWFIEINTMPGFTDHSLLPMAARQAGMDLPALTDRLVRLAREHAAGR